MPTWIPILRPPGPIISSNKTQNNETGEVYWADLVPRSGSEQQGRRPVVVISHDAFNQTQGWQSIIVVPFSTSAAQAGRGPSAVLLPQGAAGLGKDSVALCHQVTTLGQHPSRDLFWRVWGQRDIRVHEQSAKCQEQSRRRPVTSNAWPLALPHLAVRLRSVGASLVGHQTRTRGHPAANINEAKY
ncbi:MAG: type II toxin-antitoxin system PemK/MazF family toxin [Pyrinomonadaceae bacterium]|nr:type II toxin-antitoxin system PemK/MazF family toxin [Pyrinomonadaceae bacterium]